MGDPGRQPGCHRSCNNNNANSEARFRQFEGMELFFLSFYATLSVNRYEVEARGALEEQNRCLADDDGVRTNAKRSDKRHLTPIC